MPKVWRDPVKRKAWNKDYYKLMLEKGKCKCGQPLKTKYQCERCINSRDKTKRKEWNIAYRIRMKEEGRCQCGRELLKDYSHCSICRDKHNERQKRIYSEMKARLSTRYGAIRE